MCLPLTDTSKRLTDPLYKQRRRSVSLLLLYDRHRAFNTSIILLLFIASSFTQCDNKVDYCATADGDNKALKQTLGNCLPNGTSKLTADQQFVQLKDCLMTQPCVKEVEIFQGYIRTDPPMKKVLITFQHNSNAANRKLVTFSIVQDQIKITDIQNN